MRANDVAAGVDTDTAYTLRVVCGESGFVASRVSAVHTGRKRQPLHERELGLDDY
jgi:hypothetical protein